MMNLKYFFKLIALFCLLANSELLYKNLSEEQLVRLNYLSDNIRCPKCSYGNVSSSNAPISKDIKNEIARLIKDGYSDDEIFELMKNRYGNYILLNSGEDKMPIYLIIILTATTVTLFRQKCFNLRPLLPLESHILF